MNTTKNITITSPDRTADASENREWTLLLDGTVVGAITLEVRDFGLGFSDPSHGVPFVSVHPRWMADVYIVEIYNDEFDTVAKRRFEVTRDRSGEVVGASPRSLLAQAKKWAREQIAAL